MNNPTVSTKVASLFAFLGCILLAAAAFVMLLALLFASTSHAGTIVVGGSYSRTNLPFGITDAGTAMYPMRYQQIYRREAFPTAMLITQIAFRDASTVPANGAAYSLSIGLGVTSLTPQAPGTGFASGATTVLQGTRMIAPTQLAGDFDMVFSLDTPFLYEGKLGNLLLDLTIYSATGMPGNHGDSFVGLATDSSYLATIYDTGKGVVAQPYRGVSTQFTTTTVPEPTTAALLFLGAAFAFARRWRGRNIALLTLFGLLFTSQSHAATVVFGYPHEGISVPLGITSSGTAAYVGEYQQVHDGRLLPAQCLITQIAFNEASSGRTGDLLYNLSIGLAGTRRAPNYLRIGFESGVTPVFTGSIVAHVTPLAGDFDFKIDLATPFLYDRGQGNLLLDITIVSATRLPGSGAVGSFSGDGDNSVFGRIFLNNGSIVTDYAGGVVTQFTYTPVPEPATAALFFLGVVWCGRGRWRG